MTQAEDMLERVTGEGIKGITEDLCIEIARLQETNKELLEALEIAYKAPTIANCVGTTTLKQMGKAIAKAKGIL